MKPFWLLFAHSGEERRSEPVGPWLAGGPDGSIDCRRFVRSQAHGKDCCQAILFRQPRASHFLRHKKGEFVYIKYLTRFYFAFTKSRTSTIEVRPCRKNARPSLARLANRGHPVATGADSGRLATKAFSYKVEKIGSEQPGEVAP